MEKEKNVKARNSDETLPFSDYSENRLFAIQQSTHVRFRWLFLLNEKLRLRFKWYYNWRIDPRYLYNDPDEQLAAIQKSTRTTFKHLQPLHEKLRQKSSWYYKWHIRPISHTIHWVALTGYTLFIVAGIIFAFGSAPKPTKAAYTCSSQAAGGWATAGTWTSCGGGVPASGDSVVIAHAVTLSGAVDIGAGDITINSGGTLTTNNYTVTANNLTSTSGGNIVSGSSTFNITGNWYTIQNNFNQGTSTVNLSGTSNVSSYSFNILNCAASTKTTTISPAPPSSRIWINYLNLGGGTITGSYDIYLQGSNNVLTDSGSTTTSFRDLYFRANNANQNVPGRDYTGLRNIYFYGVGSSSGANTYTLQGDIQTNLISGIGPNNTTTNPRVDTVLTNGHDITATGLTVGRSGQTLWYGKLDINENSVVEINGNVSILSSGDYGDNVLEIDGGGELKLSGNFTNGDVLTSNNNSMVTLDGTTDQTITTAGQGFYNFVSYNTGSSGNDDIIISGNLVISGNLTITDGDLDLAVNDPSVNIAGDFSIASAGSVTKQNNSPVSAITFDGSGSPTVTDSTTSKQNLGKVVVYDVSLGLGSDIKCDIFQLDAEVRLEGYTLEIANAGATADVLIVNSDIFASSGTIKFSATNSSGNINIPGVNYWGDLQFSGAETYELSGDVTYGYVDSVTIDSGATLDTSASDYDIKLKGNWTNNGTFTANSGTVTFSGTASGKTIKTSASAFNILTINGSGGAWTLQDDLQATTLNVTAGTLATGALNLTIIDTATLNGGTLTGGAGDMTFGSDGVGGLTISNSGSTFTASATVNIDDAAGYVRSAGTANWTTNSSTLNLTAYTYFDLPADTYYNLVLNGDFATYSLVGATTINGNLTLDNDVLKEELAVTTYTLTVGGNVTIADSNCALSATSGTINVGGNWTNNGTFTAGTSEVIFTGTGTSTISGDNVFYDLTMDTNTAGAKQINFTASNQTIGNTWTLDGASGKVLTLRSTSDDTEWYFTIPSDFTSGDYIDVRDSYTANENFITAGANVTNSGNNGGWIFNQAPVNDSLTFSNPYSGNIAIADDTTEWTFRALVTDVDGSANLDYVEMRFANSTDSTQPYDSLKYRWTESTDAFSEQADTQSAASITSTSSNSNASGNQWTLDFKIKFGADFLAKDTQYAIELYAIDESADSDSDNYASKYQVKELSLTLDVDENSINLGNLLPGFAVTGTTSTTVTTNYPNGYALSVQDNVSGSNSLLLHTDSSTRIADYAGTIGTPTSWSGTGLGICLYSATGKDTEKWGTGTTESDENNKYAGIPENTTQIHAKTGSPTSNDISKIGYKLMVPDSQKTGTYSGIITITATGVLN